MKLYYDDSSAGAVKTERAIRSISETRCRVVFVTERKDSFDELRSRMDAMAHAVGARPTIRYINGDTSNRGGSVSKELEQAPSCYTESDHVIVITTHAALLRSHFSGFHGWRIIIDEVPAFLDFEEKVTHLDAAYFNLHYSLEPLASGWRVVQPTAAGKALSCADVRADQSHDHLSLFHARVLEASGDDTKRHVLCNLPNWDAMQKRKVKWCWASTFSLQSLAAFDRVELLGNQFCNNIGSMITRFFDGDQVEWVPLPPLPAERRFLPRAVHIHFFSERPAAKSFFALQDWKAVLREIGQHLRDRLPPGNAIWSANDTSPFGEPTPRDLLAMPQHDYIAPKQAGTNRYASVNHAAMIYAAKPSPNLRSLLNALGIAPKDWVRSVEHETILQFVTRTSVRDPNNTAPVNLYVFDRAQAEYLKGYFDSLAHVQADVSQLHLSVDVPPRSLGGRPRAQRTPQEQEVFEIEKRRKDRERKRAKRGQVRAKAA